MQQRRGPLEPLPWLYGQHLGYLLHQGPAAPLKTHPLGIRA